MYDDTRLETAALSGTIHFWYPWYCSRYPSGVPFMLLVDIMPFKDLYNLDWNTFQSHLLYTSQELHRDKLFADVTLVSEDLIQLKAHKTVLSSASEFFKDLFTNHQRWM